MENLYGYQSHTSTFPCQKEQRRYIEDLGNVILRAKSHSWPFLPAKEAAGNSSIAINSARTSWNSPFFIDTASSLPSRVEAAHKGSYPSEKSNELPGSFDLYPEIPNPTHASTLLAEKTHTPIPSSSQARSPSYEAPGFFELASRPPRSSSLAYTHRHLRHRPDSDDLNRQYTLKEALELPPTHIYDTGNDHGLDCTIGRVVPLRLGFSEADESHGTESVEDGTIEHYQLANRFYRQEPFQNTNSQEACRQGEKAGEHSARIFFKKLIRPLVWLNSIASKTSASPEAEKKPIDISPPFDPRRFASSVEPRHFNHSHLLGQPQTPFAPMRRLEEDLCPVVPPKPRRLSVTESFGPSLAENIEEAILNHNQRSVTTSLWSETDSLRPFLLSRGSSYPNWRVTQSKRFRDPESYGLPRLRVEIPSSEYPASTYAYHPSGQSRSHLPEPSSLSSEKSPEVDLSLRGGCLPASRIYESPRPRIRPSRKPADTAPVPPGLWYLASGRPVLKDKPGKPCYHGQSKRKHHSNHPHGQAGVDISHQPIPNAEPSQPLTFGYLRTWKQNSRPAPRLNPRTGVMEPGHRSFWREFAYSASRGNWASGRPRRRQGFGRDRYGHSHGQGMGMDGG
ncbi:hypothetical protein EPUS_02695 [Endocarpon pusillum Z07020]|uniref:Uncharacterized protein n=1 Tax=Endocarpon pusillum (strain Z07020 / HMAS-L-300199) TaxID=1263415 RepID=U1HHB9_ENDPU|nr:uncharacterized protein EPUS_02695 [Endocarpon pusillum Z07020]ERF68239.1 hypothetical protein EPUS_02695 [Endocarpon pusillum Z07020]